MPGRILVVDDVATNRIILKVKLTNACYEVLQASGGAEALRMAQRDRPDLILLDMSMPDIGGLEVCRRLRADPRTVEIPIIIVTANNDIDAKLAALEAGAEEFLSKPYDDLGLLARVRSLLRARSVAAELALRDGTSQALGFAEATDLFVPAGHICLVANDEALALRWKRCLREQLPDRIETSTRADALNNTGPTPDLFVVTADLDHPGGGLLLLSELRSHPDTRHAGIIVVVPDGGIHQSTMALDLGASDVVTMPVKMEELELRLRAMMVRKRQSDRLRRRVRDGLQMAVTDPLTGLYNRRYAMSHLERIRKRALESERNYAILLIDLDRFKSVNDTHGHAAGDAVIKSVAEILSSNLRPVDLVARVGGEEFLAVLPDIQPEAALNAAERLRVAAASTEIPLPPSPSRPHPCSHTQTISVGLVIGGSGPVGTAIETPGLLDIADRALYRAKDEGRNRVVVGEMLASEIKPPVCRETPGFAYPTQDEMVGH